MGGCEAHDSQVLVTSNRVRKGSAAEEGMK